MKRIFGIGKKKDPPPPCSSPGGAYELRQKDLGKLHRAAAAGDLAQVAKALKKSSIDARDKAERTALHLACASGHVDVIRYLVENKCELNLLDSDNRSPLMKAVQCQQEKCVAIVLECGADPNLADADGNTALHLAVLSPNASVARLLLKHNANINAQNKEGNTPLILAVSEHHEDIVKFLLKKGADVHVRDQHERTALMIATYGGDLNLVKVLLQYGADVSHKDTNGWTAADYAVIHGFSSIGQELAGWEDTGEASGGSLHSIPVAGTPSLTGATSFTLGAPAVDRGGMQQSPNQTSRTGKLRKAIDDLSERDSIRSCEKEGSDDTWQTSEEEELDFALKKQQKLNLKLLMNSSQQPRKNSDSSRSQSPKSPKQSLKQRNPFKPVNQGQRGELLNQDVLNASNIEIEELEEKDDENDNGGEEEEEEEEEDEEDEDLTQDEKGEEDLEDEETQSNNILEEEQREKTEPKREINQKLGYFSNAKYEGEAWCGTGDVYDDDGDDDDGDDDDGGDDGGDDDGNDDDKISQELDEKVEESVDTPVSFIAGCYEGLQENTSSMSPKRMNNELSCKSVPKQAVFQNLNNLQDTQENWNRKSMMQKFHRNADSCFADFKMTDWKKEIPQLLSESYGLEKKSSFDDSFENVNNSRSAAKNPRFESQRLNSDILEHVGDEDTEEKQYEGVDDKVCEILKRESEDLSLNRHEENLRAAFHSGAKEEEKEEQEKDDTGEVLQAAIVEDVKNSLCNDSHQVHNASKRNADVLPAVAVEEEKEEDDDFSWDSESQIISSAAGGLREVSSGVFVPVIDRYGVYSAIIPKEHSNGGKGSTFPMSPSTEKEDNEDVIENCEVQDKRIIETTNLIENTAHENQTNRAEISHQEAIAENGNSLNADKRLSPKPWEERYERIWVANEKRELKANFKNITAELKQLFGEINETGKTPSLVEELSEHGFSEELKCSHVVSSRVMVSSNKLENKGEFGDAKLTLGGKVPKMEIVIPSLGVLPDQKNLNANVDDNWSTDEEDNRNDTDNSKVPLPKGEENKMPAMAMEEKENGSSRNVEENPEYSLRHSLKTSILDVSNILPKIKPFYASDEKARFITERKLGKDCGFNDDVPRDFLNHSDNVGETEVENPFANAQQSCSRLKGNLDEELKQDLERFKSKVGMLQIAFRTLEKEKAQLQKEVGKEKSFKTQAVTKQEDVDKLITPPGNITNKQMKQELTLRNNDGSEMENENVIEEKDKKNFSSEEKPGLIKMPTKSNFDLNTKVVKTNKRWTSKQKANQQKSSSSRSQVLDDSPFSETSQDEARPAAKTRSKKEKVNVWMDVTDDLSLTHSSGRTSEELLTANYTKAMLLLEQLSVNPEDSAIFFEIQDILLEYEQMIKCGKKSHTTLCREEGKLQSEEEESQLMVEDAQDMKSILAQSDIQSLTCTLKQEEEKRLRVEMLYEKTRKDLRRKEDQYCKAVEKKRQLELHSKNLEMELVTLKKLLKQAEEERDIAQRQLSQEKSAKTPQEEILKNNLGREKDSEEETRRTIGKDSEEFKTEREKYLLCKNQLLQDEIAMLRLELDQVRMRHQEEGWKYLEENETLKEKNEDLKKELKLNEEALTQAVVQYTGQLNILKAESAVLTSKLEQAKEGRDRLEAETESFRSRLGTAVQELERHQSSKSDLERTLQRERDEWLRSQDKLHYDLSNVRETNKTLSEQLTKAESKSNSLENELHQLKQTLSEKTLLLEMTQKKLTQAQCQAKESDHARQLEKDQVSKFQIKQESMQERLAQLQSENLLLRQQLEDMHNKGISKEKAVNDVQDWFNDIFNKLRADTEKQVHLVEERNKELNMRCSDLREEVLKHEADKVEREGVIRQLQQELADALKKQSMSEASLEVFTCIRSELEEDKANLQKEVEKLKTKCKSEGKKAKKLVELKQPVEVHLEQEVERNTELQKDCKRLKQLLSRSVKKLRMHEQREFNLQEEMKSKYSDTVNDADRLRTKVGELSQQLEIESKRCMQLEAQNQHLQEELSTMRKSHEKLEKSKHQLKEEVANLKYHLETNMVDHSQIEKYKKEVEERARQEIIHKLQEVNIFLQTQAVSQDRVEQIRASHHASLTNQLKQRIRDLECEWNRLKKTQQDNILLKESTMTEVERYKQLYLEEEKNRRNLANKLERTKERLAEAKAMLLQERQRNRSLIVNGMVGGGLAASPVLYATELGHLGNSLALNRSLNLGGSFLNSIGNALSPKSKVEAFVAKVRQELDEKITKELEQATTELETGSARISTMVPSSGSSKNSLGDQDPVSRAAQEYQDVLAKNYLI